MRYIEHEIQKMPAYNVRFGASGGVTPQKV